MSREAEVAMSGAHSSEKGWTLRSQSAGMAAPQWRSVGRPQRGGQMTLSVSQVASALDPSGTKDLCHISVDMMTMIQTER
ncbi:jg6939 [Pararge aegeria aegeria]|uniref:Jg6939 protein n=1 Tax=Pararge aegeria aegeria TaxID=348720 RepID=A0A8S4S4W0_9NEOP|nr:jg6939 [Pararge aegeria aegeria]